MQSIVCVLVSLAAIGSARRVQTSSGGMRDWEGSPKSLQSLLLALNPVAAVRSNAAQKSRIQSLKLVQTRQPAATQRVQERHLLAPVMASVTSAAATQATVVWPTCKYTVPIQNLGWRGRPEQGEDPAKWYDSDGVRSGPPMNYWRQAADERYYQNNLEVVRAILRGADTEELVAALEYRMSILKPLLSRRLLGRWAPVMLRGAPLASASEAGIVVPFTLEIRRVGERKTFENRYGTFDAHLEEGEEVRFVLDEGGEKQTQAVLRMSSSQEGRQELPLPTGAPIAALDVGKISFLSDYLWLQRSADGTLSDVWLRVDGISF